MGEKIKTIPTFAYQGLDLLAFSLAS
jgi:hypothetical protein